MAAGAYGEIKASGGQYGYRVGMGEGRGYQQPRAFCSYGESLRAMESLGSCEERRARESGTAF